MRRAATVALCATARALARASTCAAALWLAACAGRPAPADSAAAADSAAPSACRPLHALAGERAPIRVRLPADAPERAGDRLVLSRLAPDTAAIVADEGRVPLEAVRAFIRHAQVFAIEPRAGELVCAYVIDGIEHAFVPMPSVVAGDARPDAISDASPDAMPDPPSTPVAFAGFGENFWGALLGRGGRELVGALRADGTLPLHGFGGLVATAGPPAATSEQPSRPTHCAGPRFVHLAGADPAHHACALLPPDHDPQRRYPAVYMLSGLAGDDTNRFGWSGFVEMADSLAADVGPALFIGVDSRSAAGSTYPSEAREKTWLDWLTGELQATAEARLGADPAADALFGQSTGGFNAVTVALLRPGAFTAVAASAPDGLDLGHWLLTADGAIHPDWLAWMRLETAVGGPGQMISYAAAWSPDRAAMPADLDTGAIRQDVLDAWLAHSPSALLDTPAGQAALRALDGRLHLSVAENDEFGLYPPVRRFAERLDALGIAHRVAVDQHGHFGLDRRLPGLMRALLTDLRAR